MRGLVITLLAVLMVVGLTAALHAESVYNTAGTAVSSSEAVMSRTAGVSNVPKDVLKDIRVRAKLAAGIPLKVNIDATTAEFDIKKYGAGKTYQAKVAVMTATAGNGDLDMTIASAENLRKSGDPSVQLGTAYAVVAGNPAGAPAAADYLDAGLANKVYDLGSGATIWGKIRIPTSQEQPAISAGGTFEDVIQVSFQQTF